MGITIKDGIGIINGEPVSQDVNYSDGIPEHPWKTRMMRIDCGNGYKLSVVFGSGSYSDNHDHGYMGSFWLEEVDRAEIAVLGCLELSEPFQEEWGDSVKGYVGPDEILEVLAKIRSLPSIVPATSEEQSAYREKKMQEFQSRLANKKS